MPKNTFNFNTEGNNVSCNFQETSDDLETLYRKQGGKKPILPHGEKELQALKEKHAPSKAQGSSKMPQQSKAAAHPLRIPQGKKPTH